MYVCLLYLSYLIFDLIEIDYKFAGMLVPVFISLFDFKDLDVPDFLKKLDCLWVKLICLVLSLVLLCETFNLLGVQYYCLISAGLLLFYNGKLGFKSTKYGFYVYYPLHLLILEGIYMLF